MATILCSMASLYISNISIYSSARSGTLASMRWPLGPAPIAVLQLRRRAGERLIPQRRRRTSSPLNPSCEPPDLGFCSSRLAEFCSCHSGDPHPSEMVPHLTEESYALGWNALRLRHKRHGSYICVSLIPPLGFSLIPSCLFLLAYSLYLTRIIPVSSCCPSPWPLWPQVPAFPPAPPLAMSPRGYCEPHSLWRRR